MKAAFVTDLQKVEIRDIPKPQISADQVLIKSHSCGVCGSDLHIFLGKHAFRKPPVILGHEIAGEIVEIGSAVSGFNIGDRVTVNPQLGCGHCHFCDLDAESLCQDKIVPGTARWLGTFCEYFPAPAVCVHKLAPAVSYEVGTLAEPFAVAVNAMHRVDAVAQDGEHKSLLILGSGTIGLMALTIAKLKGYEKIICTDPVKANRDFALQFGAYAALDPLCDNLSEQVKELTSGGADAALICAGAPNIVDQATTSVKKRGVIGIVAMITKAIPTYVYNFVQNEQILIGSICYSRKTFKESLELINNGLDLSPYVTQVFALDDTQQALDTLAQKKEPVVKIVVKP